MRRPTRLAQPLAPDYGQQFLFPPARFLREFVAQLDLPALGFALPVAGEGRPPCAPSRRWKIWLYGSFQRIRSTRKLAAAGRDHLPLIWRTGLLAPDHNRLWRLGRDQQKALRPLFKQTVPGALRTGAVGLALQALDGPQIQAAGRTPAGGSKEDRAKRLVQLDRARDDWERKLAAENADAPAAGDRLPAGLAERQSLREGIQKGLAQLAADARQSYPPVEPEARRRKIGDPHRYAYNAQAVADAPEGVIVACDAPRQEHDHGQLVPLIPQARQNLGGGRDRYPHPGRPRLRGRS